MEYQLPEPYVVSVMRWIIFAAAVLLLMSTTRIAAAAVSTGLAETGGFLLGSAHRCGVAALRISNAGQVIHRLIVAASDGASEQRAADRRFAEVFLASASPNQNQRVSIPPCKAVVAQFERLERHYREAGLN